MNCLKLRARGILNQINPKAPKIKYYFLEKGISSKGKILLQRYLICSHYVYGDLYFSLIIHMWHSIQSERPWSYSKSILMLIVRSCGTIVPKTLNMLMLPRKFQGLGLNMTSVIEPITGEWKPYPWRVHNHLALRIINIIRHVGKCDV